MTAAVDRLRPHAVSSRRPARIPGPRAPRPLIRLSCAAGPAQPRVRWVEGLQPPPWLIEAELDGHWDAEVPAEMPAEAEVAAKVATDELAVTAESERPAATEPAAIEPDERVAARAAQAPVSPVDRIAGSRAAVETEDRSAVSRAAGETEEQPAPWLLIGLVTSVLAIVVAAAVIVRASTGHSGNPMAVRASATSSSVPSSPSAQQARAVAWIVEALSRRSNLVTDASTRASLLARGLAPDTVFAAGQPLPAPANFVVSTGQLRAAAAAGRDPATARLLAESEPVVRFGSGADSVEVREVIPTGTRPDVVAASRTMAGRALLSNKALSVGPEAATLLSEGRLDLRAATLIAALTAQTPVRLVGLPQQPVEASAGAPIRTVQLELGESPGLLGEYIEALPADYRPAASLRQRDGSYVVQWRPDLDPAPPVS